MVVRAGPGPDPARPIEPRGPFLRGELPRVYPCTPPWVPPWGTQGGGHGYVRGRQSPWG